MKTTSLSAPLPTDVQLSPEIQAQLKKMPPLNVFRMMANVPQTFMPFISVARSLLQDGKFDPRLREIATLRVAHLTDSAYEWHQHAFLAEGNGVTADKIKALKSDKPITQLSEEENFVCRVAEELTLNSRLSDDTFKKLYKDYSPSLACELIVVISYFNMLARFLNGTRVQIEESNPLQGRSSPVG